MLIFRCCASILSAGLLVLGPAAASGQNYPDKPIRLISGEPAGGIDFVARPIAQVMAEEMKAHIVIDNRGSASGAIAGQTLATAPADGYTLLFYSSGIWLLPLLRKVPYDPLKDFSSISLAAQSPNVLVVYPGLPVHSVKELVDLAKARPGELNDASGATGAANHLGAELFKLMAGVKIVRIPFKGSGPATNAVISGQVQIFLSTPGATGAFIKNGRLRAIAVSSAQPSALFPGLPTIAASGYPGYESVTAYAMFGPPRLPAALIQRLNRATNQALKNPGLKEKYFNIGVETVGTTPEQLAATMKSDSVKFAKVIKEVGIRPED